jgi:endoglucanase
MTMTATHRTAARLVPLLLIGASATGISAQGSTLVLQEEREYFTSPGVDVIVFSSWYDGYFGDEKVGGVELIHHDVRTGTNGDVRLSPTPEQWDPVPEFLGRETDADAGRLVASLAYPDHGFAYRVVVEPRGEGFLVQVQADAPLPDALVGRAGFNFEFLPSAYFGHAYLMDDRPGLFPRHPTGPMAVGPADDREAGPLATGSTLVLAPDDAERRVAIDGRGAELALYDGRNRAQNGWFVVRSLLPAGETGTVIEWLVTPSRAPDWRRTPVIAHSQAGYHPDQAKVAVLETGHGFDGPAAVTVYEVEPDGRLVLRKQGEAAPWGPYLRYDYYTFDFSDVTDLGVYVIEFAGITSAPFPIAEDVLGPALWSSTLDTFMPVQMDHMHVNDRYRVWHGAGHLDDALQAPTDHTHFDLYQQGPTTDTRFEPFEHIPGLDVGGWHDAGDYDIRTQSQYATVSDMVLAYETFGIDWDETTVEPANRYVDLRRPDGIPDAVQQIAHGARYLLAQYDAVGHAINGIIVPTLEQYTHLGDALTMTDNRVYDPSLDSLEVRGDRSGRPDDRWAFTNRSTALEYGSAAGLAAASRALRGHDDALAERALETAVRVWDEEQARGEPIIYQFGNTTGGPLFLEELAATVELLVTTGGGERYADRLAAMWPELEERFAAIAPLAVRALPYMDDAFRRNVENAVREYAEGLDRLAEANPFGVPITTGGWGGSGSVLRFGVGAYLLHESFPDLVGPEHTLRALEYVLGTHPASSVSMVSGIGASSHTTAYGANRADYSFIPGGIVPGIVVIPPDYPEMKEDWPFLWYEGEYVIPLAPAYIFLANAAADLVR